MAGLADKIKVAARDLGFEVVGVTSVRPFEHDLANLIEWCEAGYAAEMSYMTRRPQLHGHPKELVPAAVSLLSLAVNYYSEIQDRGHEGRYGRVARYAWGRDYHDVVKPRLSKLAQAIEALAGRPIRWRGFVDAVPLLERAAAVRSGLGFFGKNTNLLQPSRGSWFFIAEILLDLELQEETRRVQISCGTCDRCLVACPTGAFAGPYKLDSRRCISYLTIEHKGVIPVELREGFGEWLFGCDVCQEVCPFNRFSSETDWPEFQPAAGAGHRLDLVNVLSIATDAEFRNRFAGTAMLRPKRRGLLRNAAIVARNIGCTAAVPALIDRIKNDTEPLIRSHSLWALAGLDRNKVQPLIGRTMSDPDPIVREEARSLAEKGL